MIVARAADPVEAVALALLEPAEVFGFEVTHNWKAVFFCNGGSKLNDLLSIFQDIAKVLYLMPLLFSVFFIEKFVSSILSSVLLLYLLYQQSLSSPIFI